MKITDVRRQKRNARRFSIHLEGVYAFSASDESVSRFRLEPGRELDAAGIDEILRSDEQRAAMDCAVKLLGIRARSRAELAAKLKMKEFSPGSIEHTLNRVQELGYIDDARFARDRIQYLQGRGDGSDRIRMELRRAGVSTEIIAGAMAELKESPEEELERVRSMAASRIKRLVTLEPRKARERLAGFLLRRGFPTDIVQKVVRGLNTADSDDL